MSIVDMTTTIVETSIDREVFSVSALNHLVRELLEHNFPLVWVEGEISNLACPSSGHFYFTLKDPQAQIRCAMFRGNGRLLNFALENGLKVLVKGKISLYPNRGDFQLIVDYVEAVGNGALQRAFEELKKKLAQEGIFDSRYKKPLPAFPRAIGVITSPTGAAIRDILSVLKRRFAAIPVFIYPSSVQGAGAASQIVTAIAMANRHQACDVLMVSRGGGSLEDLWPFNEESVARAMFASHLPIVSGIGHEIDFTIADFVADQRAPTPSAAAELLTPTTQQTYNHYLVQQAQQLQQKVLQLLKQQHLYIIQLQKRLRHPGQIIRDKMQDVDNRENRLFQAYRSLLTAHRNQLLHLANQLKIHSPCLLIERYKHRYLREHQQLIQTMKDSLAAYYNRLAKATALLNSFNPLATLQRGYAITYDTENHVICDSQQVNINDKITVVLAQGKLACQVTAKEN